MNDSERLLDSVKYWNDTGDPPSFQRSDLKPVKSVESAIDTRLGFLNLVHRTQRYPRHPRYALSMPDRNETSAESLAALRLVVAGRSYEDVASALAINETAVRELARNAIDSFSGAAATNLTESERGRITDWLLAQSSDEPLVQASPAARGYAEAAISAALTRHSIALRQLPDTKPASAKQFVVAPAANQTQSQPVARAAQGVADTTAEPAPAKRAGIALLGLAAAALLVGVLAVAGVFSSSESNKPTASSTLSSTTPTKQQQGPAKDPQLAGWTLSKRFDLIPVTGSSGRGIAGLETKGQQHALLVAGTGLPAGSVVGIWVTGGPAPGLVGFQRVTSKGEFSAVGAVPASAAQADRLIVTEERISKASPPPTAPGRVLLSSPFRL